MSEAAREAAREWLNDIAGSKGYTTEAKSTCTPEAVFPAVVGEEAIVSMLVAFAASHVRLAKANPFEEAVAEACITIFSEFYPDDAKRTLANLIQWECKSALDPRVSKEAAELVRLARVEGMEAAAKIAEYHHNNHCENNDTTYKNCGTAIASGIRALIDQEESR